MAWIFYYKEVIEKSVCSEDLNSLVNKSDNEEGGINHMPLLWALAQKISWAFFFSADFFEGRVRYFNNLKIKQYILS